MDDDDNGDDEDADDVDDGADEATIDVFADRSQIAPIEFSKTQRGRDMLVYCGYRYVQNRQSTRNKFWRCSRYVKYGCRATVVTSKNPTEPTIRLAGAPHSHGPDATTTMKATRREEQQTFMRSRRPTLEPAEATPTTSITQATSMSTVDEVALRAIPHSRPVIDDDAADPDALPKSLFNESGDEFEYALNVQ